MLENSERSVRGVRMGKSGPLERAELANQIQGFRIPDRWDASEKNKYWYYILTLATQYFGGSKLFTAFFITPLWIIMLLLLAYNEVA